MKIGETHPMLQDDDLIHRTAEWMRRSAAAIQEASGNVDAVLSRIPPELLVTLVRNGLVLAYIKPPT